MDTLTEDKFSFWLPAQVVSKGNKAGDADKRVIQGIASTDSKDFQNEIVKQTGIDTDYFIKHGYFNNDHKPGAENKVGEPTECKITKDGLWVKGIIYKGKKAADDIWDHFNALDKSGAKRRMGFSIEGKVVRRNGNVIEQCKIMDIAITPCPVNATTWAEVAKSLSAEVVASKNESKAKSLTTSAPLASESLDEELKDNRTCKGMSLEEVVALVKSQYDGLSDEAASNIGNVIFSSLGDVSNVR